MRTLSDESLQADDGGLKQRRERRTGTNPERRCVLTGESGPKRTRIRLVAGPAMPSPGTSTGGPADEGTALWPDLAERLPGRGVWISADRALLEKAIASGALRKAVARSLGAAPPAIDPGLPEQITNGLERRLLDRLGLEHRGGHLIFGFDRLREWILSSRVSLVLHAADAAPDGTGKLAQALRVAGLGTPMTLPSGRRKLSSALGRDNVTHLGVADAGAANRIRTDLERWLLFTAADRKENGNRWFPVGQTDEGQE